VIAARVGRGHNREVEELLIPGRSQGAVRLARQWWTVASRPGLRPSAPHGRRQEAVGAPWCWVESLASPNGSEKAGAEKEG